MNPWHDSIWASGLIVPEVGSPTIVTRDGFGAVTRNGDGDVTITLDREIDILNGEGVILAGVVGNGPSFASIDPVSDSQMRLRARNLAGALVNGVGISFIITRVK